MHFGGLPTFEVWSRPVVSFDGVPQVAGARVLYVHIQEKDNDPLSVRLIGEEKHQALKSGKGKG